VLRDFYTTGDVIRIKLPFINWQQNGDVKNQYLWIENRQKISAFDVNQFGDAGCKEPLSKGLYMQIQVGKDFKFGSSGNVFPGYGSSDWQKPNSLSSWLFPMTAEGNFDYHFGEAPVTSQWNTDCGWGNTSEPINKTDPLMLPNPFTGLNDYYIYWNTNGDDKLYQGDTVQPWLNERINGNIVWNALQKGDSTDAFKLSGKKKIGISTNPAPVPVFTFRTKDTQNDGTLANYSNPASWENRVIHLNGLSIEILSETANDSPPHCLDGSVPGDEKVRIRWDDYDITDKVRWCADSIVLHESISGATSYSLNIKSGNSITPDRSISPNRHKAVEQINGEWYFNEKTKMTCDANSYFHIEGNAD
jgi:hypothetical protein